MNRVIFEYQLHTRTNQKFKVPALTLSLSQLGFAPQLDYTASDTIIMAAVLIALPSGSDSRWGLPYVIYDIHKRLDFVTTSLISFFVSLGIVPFWPLLAVSS